MISRRLIFEISVAILVFGCIVLFTDQRNDTQTWLQVSQDSWTQVAKSQAMERFHVLQSNLTVNCSQYNANISDAATKATTNTTQTIRALNASGQLVTYTINMTAACAPVVATTFVIPKSNQDVVMSSVSRAYRVIMNIDCMVGAEGVKSIFAAFGGIQTSQISVSEYTCGSVAMTYSCNAATTSDAESTCAQISRAACNPSSSLYSLVRGSSCGLAPTGSSGSSTSLYGLFALVALPILLCACLILWYRNSQREADNQYTQDTATFSNVATSPQPLGVPQNTPVPAEYATSPSYGAPTYTSIPQQPVAYPPAPVAAPYGSYVPPQPMQ